MNDVFEGAEWIARPVPRGQRIVRNIAHDNVDRVSPGHSLAQTFSTEGPVTCVSISLVGPEVEDPFGVDVKYTVSLETAAGGLVSARTFEGPQLVWDYFGCLVDVNPPAPAGDYVVTLRSERETIGWAGSAAVNAAPDDGVSPLPVVGTAMADGSPVEGVRSIGVDSLPAPNPLFRRTFHIDGRSASASLAATVLGTGVIRINGARVGEGALEPAITDYDKTVLYERWDVGHLLREGENELVIEAGRERYSARGGDVWGWNLPPWHREPVALARLEIVGEHGFTTSVVTDSSWETAPGPVEAERLFRGEDWVFRAMPPEWEPATVVAPPLGALRPTPIAPVRALAPMPARVVERLDEQRTVYDFGEVMVGRIRCRISGLPGAVVRVRSGEQRTDDGQVVCDNVLVAGEAQLDTIRLEANAVDYVWEPQFGYRGFRWMQVETSDEVIVEEVRAIPIYADLPRTGDFTSDNPILEWIDTATGRTFRNNLHGIPTDTPIYEKNGWTADAHLATEGLLHHYDLRAPFGKWIADHVDAQADDGSVPQIIPTPGWGRASDPTWSASAVLIPWYLYREYGDRAILETAAPMARRFADQLIRSLGGGLWRGRTWGDWLAPGHLVPPEGMTPIGTIMSVSALQHTAAVFRELGDGSADSYDNHATTIGARYHETYFDSAIGGYAVPGVGYRQALNILPLAFGVVPDQHLGAVRAGLIADLEHRTDGHLDCGAVGIRHLLPVLSDADRDDLAITVLTRTSRPGWGAWFENGETTLLESWDVDARSRNHYFLGSVSAWIQQRVGGLRLTEPGWRRFEISPVDDPRVSRARIRHLTPLGEAGVSWQRGAGGWRFEIVVPTGAEASLRVAGLEETVGPGEHVRHVPAAAR